MTWNPVSSLTRAARNAPWIVMAVVLHLAVLVVLSIWYVAQDKRPAEVPPITIVLRGNVETLPEEDVKPIEVIRDNAIPPIDREQELVTFEVEYLPDVPFTTEDVVTGDPTSALEVGDLQNMGSTAIGVGEGGIRGAGVDPFGPGKGKGRIHGFQDSQKDRRQEYEMVLKGLTWLARHQNADGSWTTSGLRSQCDPAGCAEAKADANPLYDEGVTSLAILCFLGAGYSHESKQYVIDPVRGKRHRIGDVVRDGLKWLVDRQKPDGSFTRDRAYLYNEALATMAVCEAYGLTRSRYYKERAQKAVAFLERAQRPSPSGEGLWGWRYEPRSVVEDLRGTTGAEPNKELYDADTSITTWCAMALKSAELADLAVERRSMDGALAFVKWVTVDNGLVGYVDPKGAGATVTGKNDHFRYHPAVMSALGMCTRAFVAHDAADPVLEASAKHVAADLPEISKDRLSVDYYYWYYGSLALNQFDGPDSPRKTQKLWGAWNKAVVAALDELQTEEPKSCRHGGWLVPDRWSYAGGPIYSTALSVLTLEVSYRYANAFAGVKRAR
jgi:hypothetical protein